MAARKKQSKIQLHQQDNAVKKHSVRYDSQTMRDDDIVKTVYVSKKGMVANGICTEGEWPDYITVTVE